ncbi:MAG: YdcF family protein [Candidatus Paceibacterota bacterium]
MAPRVRIPLSPPEMIEKFITIQKYLAINDVPEKSDVVFVFGQIKMPKVWDRACQLYKDGFANKILVSGGAGKIIKELRPGFTEAEIIKDYLVSKGLPGNKIIVEDEATNTLENVILGMKKLNKETVYPKKIIAVSKPFHMRRCLATFEKYFPEIKVLCCPPIGEFNELMDRPLAEYNQRLLGELKRLKDYGDKGDIKTQNIPDEFKNLF